MTPPQGLPALRPMHHSTKDQAAVLGLPGKYQPDSYLSKTMNKTICSREQLIDALDAGHRPGFLFFWGHRASADGSIGRSCLSQWFASSFEVDGCHYPTAEHYMMVRKAELFGDHERLNQILRTNKPADAKALGREVTGFSNDAWEAQRWQIVVDANTHKFKSNPRLLAFFLGTAPLVLVEASPIDPIWGIGLDAKSPDAVRPSQWPGLNLLGFALMEVRENLKLAKASAP